MCLKIGDTPNHPSQTIVETPGDLEIHLQSDAGRLQGSSKRPRLLHNEWNSHMKNQGPYKFYGSMDIPNPIM
jgi:hypothetical protein